MGHRSPEEGLFQGDEKAPSMQRKPEVSAAQGGEKERAAKGAHRAGGSRASAQIHFQFKLQTQTGDKRALKLLITRSREKAALRTKDGRSPQSEFRLVCGLRETGSCLNPQPEFTSRLELPKVLKQMILFLKNHLKVNSTRPLRHYNAYVIHRTSHHISILSCPIITRRFQIIRRLPLQQVSQCWNSGLCRRAGGQWAGLAAAVRLAPTPGGLGQVEVEREVMTVRRQPI
ncbi:uncharacterized protein LOC122240779 [Panthera tigris]|uniref:uncharacterized protein LOC122240779 n=1 Tax=Panthera tigris TaxID=9694 RepID=UPI001C6FA7D3|nr:uncharacterized protein LOC122240779 [Panthera tigris]